MLVKLTPAVAPVAEIEALAAVPMLPPTAIVPEFDTFPLFTTDWLIDAT